MNLPFRSLDKFRIKCRSLFFRRRVEVELDNELQSHLALQIEAFQAAGLPNDEARKQALASMVGLHLVKERCRDMRGFNLLDDFLADVRYGWRSLCRNAGFAVAAIGIVGLGIGSATAVFSAVDRLLFKSMPYAAPQELVSVGFTLPFMEQEFLFGSTYFEWQHQTTPFKRLGSWAGVAGCDVMQEHPVRLVCALADANFLPALGISPERGRNFTTDEDRPNGPKVALISDAMWRGRFGSNSEILGKLISVDGAPTRIVGVLPREFELPNMGNADLLLPQALDPAAQRPGVPLKAIGRLKPGMGAEQAKSQSQPLARRLMETAPPQLRSQIHFVLRPLSEYQTSSVARSASLLLGSVLLIVILSCSNVANLLIARAFARQREIRVRSALGAGRNRLMRQTVTEGLLLSTLGGVLGYGLSWLLLLSFKHLAPTAIPRLADASLNGRVLLFCLSLSFLSGLLLGVAPALMAIPAATLAGRSVRLTGGAHIRQLLTSSQVALSLLLLMLSAVFLQSLWKLTHVSLGIRTDHVMTAQMQLESTRYLKTSAQEQFLTDLESRLRRLPGVTAVAYSDTLPPGGFVHTRPTSALHVSGRPASDPAAGQVVAWRSVTPDYFRTLGIPILHGRAFEANDRSTKESPMIISQTLARQLFGNRAALGQRIQLNPQAREAATVVGIAGDVKNKGAAFGADPEYYMVRKSDRENAPSQISLLARVENISSGGVTLLIRSRLTPDVVAQFIRSEVADLDPTLPVQISTLDRSVQGLSDRPRFEAALLSFFGLTGLLLSTAGIYGLISFFVVGRIPEIGLRMALGASPGSIRMLVLKHSLTWVASGIVVGLALTFWAAQAAKSLLFATSPSNPFLLLITVGLLVISGGLAAFFPSRRASLVDPLVALRHE